MEEPESLNNLLPDVYPNRVNCTVLSGYKAINTWSLPLWWSREKEHAIVVVPVAVWIRTVASLPFLNPGERTHFLLFLPWKVLQNTQGHTCFMLPHRQLRSNSSNTLTKSHRSLRFCREKIRKPIANSKKNVHLYVKNSQSKFFNYMQATFIL